VISRCHSLLDLYKTFLFLEGKLCYLGIAKLPATSTLSDANINRSSDLFASIYHKLYQHYRAYLSNSYIKMFIGGEVVPYKVEIFDSSTVSLFVDIFKGAGRNSLDGKKKGSLKIHTKMLLSSFVPDFIHLTEAAYNDKTFLEQLNPCPYRAKCSNLSPTCLITRSIRSSNYTNTDGISRCCSRRSNKILSWFGFSRTAPKGSKHRFGLH
jgi:hypothetical protein